jgi:hypothetical protein
VQRAETTNEHQTRIYKKEPTMQPIFGTFAALPNGRQL